MAWPEIAPLVDRGFRAAVAAEELKLTGSADIAAVESLEALIARIHEVALAERSSAVVLDIAGLEFMSATCFNVLINWISLIQDAALDQRYQIRIRSNAAIPWQRRSLRTLACFATNLVTVI